MAYKTSYLKEIESYFLSLTGKGIMLSSRDYNLILNWRKRKVPKEIVFKGIRNAFNSGLMEKKGTDRVLNLSQIAYYIEEEIRDYRITIGDKSYEEIDSEHKTIKKIIERLNTIIKSEKRVNVRKNYLDARNKLMQLLGSNITDTYRAIGEIEEDFYDYFFEALSKTERDEVSMEAERKISKRSRLMTEKARLESFSSFRNEILKRDYGLADIFGDD